MKTYFDIDYCGQGDDMRRLDVFAPDEACRATVIWTHGGGLEAGSRKGFDGIAAQLCAQGIAFVSVEYRMYPAAAFPAFIEDCAAASRWVFDHAAQYGLSGRVFFGGSSAGGYLSMMLCFAPEYLAAVGLKSADFAGYIFDAGQPTTHFNVLKYRGEDSRLCRLDEAAPLYHIHDEQPGRPLKIIFSEHDMPARPEQNRLLIATLQHFGYDMSKIDVSFMEGYGHCGYAYKVENGRWILADLIGDFVDKALREG